MPESLVTFVRNTHLGEVLTYIVNRASAQDIVRVVSWRKGTGQVVKGTRFPQPDFLIKDAGGLAALEVKSTEAFDFVDLRDAKKKWMWLQPCSSVSACRELALPQLAFVGGALTAQQHSLVVQDGTVVPFPVGKGVAATVIAVDGRTNTLREDPKYKTPKNCRDAKRNCWSCLPSGCHFVLITMPNAPGMLSLGGAAKEDDERNWLHAYERWGQALNSGDLFAVRSSVKVLAEAVLTWLNDVVDDVQADVLRGFWGSYMGDAMRTRGFDVNVSEALGDLGSKAPSFDWTAAKIEQPVCREVNYDDIERLVFQGYESAAPFMISMDLRQDIVDPESETMV